MSDASILDQIHDLVDQEHRLREQLGQGVIEENEENRRLREIEIQLDRCWDLLRQRKARREAGQNPDAAESRPPAPSRGISAERRRPWHPGDGCHGRWGRRAGRRAGLPGHLPEEASSVFLVNGSTSRDWWAASR